MKYIFFLLLFLTACVKPDEAKLQKGGALVYFDLKGLVAKQAALLTQKQAMLSKQVVVNGKPESFNLKNVSWEKELRPFSNADINKPVLVGAYSISEKSEGHRHISVYEALRPDREVKRIIVYKEGGEVVEVEVDFSEDNPIYHSMRAMKMQLKGGILFDYKVSGFQKLTLDDTLSYELTANVAFGGN